MDRPMPATTHATTESATPATRAARRLVYRVLCLLCLSMPAAHSGHAQETLRLTFAEGTAATQGYSTRAPLVLSVMDGKELILERASGRDYQLEASAAAWSWTQVQQIPRNSSTLRVTPRRKANTVQLQVSYRAQQADDVLSYSATVSGELGEWIVLLGARPADSPEGGRHYSTTSVTDELAVKVELAVP